MLRKIFFVFFLCYLFVGLILSVIIMCFNPPELNTGYFLVGSIAINAVMLVIATIIMIFKWRRN